MNIDRLKSDHNAIMNSVTELRGLIKEGVETSTDKIAGVIVDMTGKIKLHLYSEDGVLYPVMMRSSNAKAAEMSRAYQSEMGAITNAYVAYAGKWNVGKVIAADVEGFRAESEAVFKALHQRIQRENTELYPLAEQL